MEDKPSKPGSLDAEHEAQMHRNQNHYSAKPAEELLRELRMTGIDLEKQNAELRLALAEIKASRDHYASLYDASRSGISRSTATAR